MPPTSNDQKPCGGRTIHRSFVIAVVITMLLFCAGCGGGAFQNPGTTQQGLAPPPPAATINSYFGTTGHIWNTKIDHVASQINGEDTTRYGVQLSGSIIGSFATVGGFLDLTLTTLPDDLVGQPVGFSLEIPGRAGLVRYGNDLQALIPLAPTNACTVINGTVTYNYVTIPDGVNGWVPGTDSTYGTFQVTIAGSTWNFSNITQFTLSGGAPASPGAGLPTGFCGIGITSYTVTAASNANNPPVATVTMGFGPSGFFLEDNGSAQATPVGVVPSSALGAGVGAIGVIQPSSPLNTNDVVSAQYLGFYYEPGIGGGGAVTQIASFGCSGTACPLPPSSTAMVGGVFPNDDPTQPPNQDVSIDLGTQNANSAGLYASATVTISGVGFPAAAVVGSMEGKYGIFLIAEDTINNVPLAIYLFQK